MRSITAREKEWETRCAPLDDMAMEQHIRALAVSLNPDGEAVPSKCPLAALRTPASHAAAFAEEQDSLPASLEWLAENGRLVEAYARSLCRPCSKKLPAVHGTVRVERIMQSLVRHSDALVTSSRLTRCLRAFDEVRALRMDELWAVPAALASALCAEYAAAAAQAVRAQKERLAALRWLEEGAPVTPALIRHSPAFFECALKRMHDMALSAKHSELTKWLEERDRSAEKLIALEHEKQALGRLLMSNVLATLRMLDTLDWSECFRRVSRTELILMNDPAGTYARMDDESRAQVRSRVACIARKTGVGEATIARCALEGAAECDDIRREICWWTNTDAGTDALLRRAGLRAPMPPVIPDPKGVRYIYCVLGLGLLLAIGAACLAGWAAALIALPVLMGASAGLINTAAARILRPRPLLRLKLDSIPDEYRTLVVMPALLSSPERAKELAAQLVTLGCLEQDENLSFLLLGDLPDHSEENREGDQEIVQAAEKAMEDANLRAGREKYHFLHRPRVLQSCEGRWMGRERKRGALNALNRLLLTGESAFVQPSACALYGRYSFVITLDAGTRMLPETTRRLTGALAHPLNRLHREPDGRMGGYSLLAPRMELAADAVNSRFVELYGGKGGVDSYPTAVSDVYQDLCGQGSFGGKGIYDVEAFSAALEGKLPDNAILSHDLIEGIIARAGFLSDVALYDGHPRTVRSFLTRQERWTRGDWQLLPLLLSKKLRLNALDRYRLIDNLIRSLVPVSQLLLFYAGLYLRLPAAVVLGFIPALLPIILSFRMTKDAGMRALLRIALLPQEALINISAIFRALWRMTVSHRRLLQWVTADDADRRGGHLSPAPGWIASALLLPALIAPAPWLLTDVLLAALWWTGATLAEALEQPVRENASFSSEDRGMLHDLAERTFRFFSENVSDTGLPPDNVQIDPPVGAALRTSPTNIGLYLAACVSARELGIISMEELSARASQTLNTLERLEKWNGQLYNWYHTETLEPLRPRYVSSVDSGNLAACLLLCARALEREGSTDLAARMERLTREMDFTCLFDEKRRLFVIGMDVENDRLSASHYDLLASESRILSFTAMMLGQIPVKHWSRLGRMIADTGHGEALTSWSGTMFEYLMPDLILPVYRGTLLHQTQESVIAAQMARSVGTDGRSMPWGVSESGYYAFDLSLSYQYRAFGLPVLALRGDAADRVVAPYASMLALPFEPDAVCHNLRLMADMGLMDEQGLFEAVDCSPERLPENADMRIVKSHMAHHQGMILCALCNALTDGALVRLFTDRSEAQALLLLLQEKPAARVRLAVREEEKTDVTRRPLPARTMRVARPDAPIPDTHLLSGLHTTAALCADGSGFVRQDGILLSRREADPSMPPQGVFVHAHDRTQNRHLVLTGMKRAPSFIRQHAQFDAGHALWRLSDDRMDSHLRAFVSPEDGAFLQEITLTNRTSSPIELDVTACFQVALSREEDYQAHPVFQNLFVESSLPAMGVLRFHRRPRAAQQHDPVLLHAVSGADSGQISWETDLMRLVGRDRLMHQPGSLPDSLSGTLGSVLTPCSALRVRINLPAHGKRSLCFAAGLASCAAEEKRFIERHASPEASTRAMELASTRARELLRYLGLVPAMHHLLQRAAALLLYPRLHAPQLSTPTDHDLRREDLWALGISGDLPILLAHAARADRLETVRELIRAHEFYRTMGMQTDLVLVNDYGNDYEQPVRDRLNALIAGSHLCGSTGGTGGVHLIDGPALTPLQRETLNCAADVLITDEGGALAVQLRSLLEKARMPAPIPDELQPSDSLSVPSLAADNGWGGFTEEGYLIYRTPAPAPWCNILCNADLGTMLSERGGGFTWYKNSRNGRITPFDNDPTREGWGDLLMLRAPDGTLYAPARLPGLTVHMPGASRFEGACASGIWTLTQFVDSVLPVKCQHLTLKTHTGGVWQLIARIDWLMGVTRTDCRLTAVGENEGLVWARGSIGATAFSTFDRPGARLETGLLTLDLSLNAGEEISVSLLLGAARDMQEIHALMARWKEKSSGAHLSDTLSFWRERLSAFEFVTPDPRINRMLNSFLPYQTLAGRIWGRAGFYQAGGAYGFRDQLQDMLAMLPSDPGMVRNHILLCAAHQFQAGDVQHWWHPERTGVRTHISDDMLFLPYVTAEYVLETGDADILKEEIPFLKDVEIPAGREDWYGEAEVSGECAPLHEHCLRAIRRALRPGAHGLILMGTGDWNDGMNRVGHRGRGESVWLTEFMIVVLEKYAPLCAEDIQAEFREYARALREAIEQHGWDGRWYRRAFMDDGTVLGGAESEGGCRMDALAQSWAVMAGLSRERVKTAMAEADRQLIDREHGLIRLLTPPFDADTPDPGYIRGYPPGVRENGGQYTHAACWVVMALAQLGLSERAWEAFRMLMPYTHADTEEKAHAYRVEPYVMAADIYGEPPHEGRGGWTWYTGAAGWMLRAACASLMGYARRGEYAALNALLPSEWDEASVRVRVGRSVYTLTARRSCLSAELDGNPIGPDGVRLTDDGQDHTAVFPIRRGE